MWIIDWSPKIYIPNLLENQKPTKQSIKKKYYNNIEGFTQYNGQKLMC